MTGGARSTRRMNGGVIWICGLAGAGKTTLATEVVSVLSRSNLDATLLDGDAFRRSEMPTAGFSRDARLLVAQALQHRTWSLASAGTTCVVATISLFETIHKRNREFSRQRELPLLLCLLDADERLRNDRRPGQLVNSSQWVGAGIAAELPEQPDHHFVNDGSMDSLLSQAQTIRNRWLSMLDEASGQR